MSATENPMDRDYSNPYLKNLKPDEFFDSLGNTPAYIFEHVLQKPYLTNCNRLQDFGSNTCGLYYIYYTMCRYAGMIMRDFVNTFSVRELEMNDRFV